MPKYKKPLKQTKMIDNWKCPWCRSVNSPCDVDGSPDWAEDQIVTCPKCEHEVLILTSIEFICRPSVGGVPLD
ncbi:hypothetical protein SAMN05421543_12359 [Alicyclobacillus macrosporangiidus]|uniref:CPXCG motif-containing cysteine-rich protein n=1 Tax=Alicyclobacillus macrosporangiidus TaxID=392015 RepID=A0A1I7L2K0_9BACL|nr:hypothetical protein SAMN05421543_12359 [Alicyclobacillus macrosporangiidus]